MEALLTTPKEEKTMAAIKITKIDGLKLEGKTEFSVSNPSGKEGRLIITSGGIDWKRAGAQRAIRLTWGQLTKLTNEQIASKKAKKK